MLSVFTYVFLSTGGISGLVSFLGRVQMGMSSGGGYVQGVGMSKGMSRGGYSPSSSMDTCESTNISISYHVQTLLPVIKYIPYGKYLLGWFHNKWKRHGSN